MGVLLDSSVVIAAERRKDTPTALMVRIRSICGDEAPCLSAVGYTELVHGVYRKDTALRRRTSRHFIDEIASQIPVHPYTREVAELAGKIDAQQDSIGVSVPFADLLIGATALSLGYSMLTTNLRHFRLIPGLNVIPF